MLSYVFCNCKLSFKAFATDIFFAFEVHIPHYSTELSLVKLFAILPNSRTAGRYKTHCGTNSRIAAKSVLLAEKAFLLVYPHTRADMRTETHTSTHAQPHARNEARFLLLDEVKLRYCFNDEFLVHILCVVLVINIENTEEWIEISATAPTSEYVCMHICGVKHISANRLEYETLAQMSTVTHCKEQKHSFISANSFTTTFWIVATFYGSGSC